MSETSFYTTNNGSGIFDKMSFIRIKVIAICVYDGMHMLKLLSENETKTATELANYTEFMNEKFDLHKKNKRIY